MGIEIDKTELKEAVREVIREELLKLEVSLTPFVSDEEMKIIEKTFTDDDFREGEFVDGKEWLGR
jgi:hypothetical protein